MHKLPLGLFSEPTPVASLGSTAPQSGSFRPAPFVTSSANFDKPAMTPYEQRMKIGNQLNRYAQNGIGQVNKMPTATSTVPSKGMVGKGSSITNAAKTAGIGARIARGANWVGLASLGLEGLHGIYNNVKNPDPAVREQFVNDLDYLGGTLTVPDISEEEYFGLSDTTPTESMNNLGGYTGVATLQPPVQPPVQPLVQPLVQPPSGNTGNVFPSQPERMFSSQSKPVRPVQHTKPVRPVQHTKPAKQVKPVRQPTNRGAYQGGLPPHMRQQSKPQLPPTVSVQPYGKNGTQFNLNQRTLMANQHDADYRRLYELKEQRAREAAARHGLDYDELLARAARGY